MKRRKFFKTVGLLAVATQVSPEIFGQDAPESVMTIAEYGTKVWKNSEGKLHRTDGPAVECSNGTKYWYVNNMCHRLDGPAIEFSNGTQYWYVNDMLHRTDGPAIDLANGDREWHQNGQLHREYGPAIEHSNGYKKWYLNDSQVTEQDVMG